MGTRNPSEVAKLHLKLEVMLIFEYPPFLLVPLCGDYLLPELISCLFASVAPEMITACGGHGEEAGDGPEAGRDSSPLPGCGHGGVCCHCLLYPGHDHAAPLPEEVLNSPGCPPPPAILLRVWYSRNPGRLPTPPLDFTSGKQVWTIPNLRVN